MEVGGWAISGQELKDVVIDDYFVELDALSAEGTVGLDFEGFGAAFADGVVHAADDEGGVFGAVVGAEADVAFVYAFLELLADAVSH